MGLADAIVRFLAGFRKFSLGFLVLLTGVILRVFDYLDGNQFVGLVQPVIVAFMGANVFEHGFLMIRDWLDRRKGATNANDRQDTTSSRE